jgi:hypothetical protein
VTNTEESNVQRNVLILGASYGSLLGTKLAMAGHRATLVCTDATAALINREGTIVRFPLRHSGSWTDVASKDLPGTVSASSPRAVDVEAFDLVVPAMQDAQYRAPDVRALMRRIARAHMPCFAIMNMPPVPYLQRIPALAVTELAGCYADPGVWDGFDPQLTTLASPDPQAVRPPDRPKNVLHVGLATNFKAARFDHEEPTALLRELGADIENARLDTADGPLDIPVKLKVHDSIFVPLAKWPMLITGNYRCIGRDRIVSIQHAVHRDIDESRRIYSWVHELCSELGANVADLVPFEKYARAAESLAKPSAAARALEAGATHIERVDEVIRCVAQQLGKCFDQLHEITSIVEDRLRRNRRDAEMVMEAIPPAVARAPL